MTSLWPNEPVPPATRLLALHPQKQLAALSALPWTRTVRIWRAGCTPECFKGRCPITWSRILGTDSVTSIATHPQKEPSIHSGQFVGARQALLVQSLASQYRNAPRNDTRGPLAGKSRLEQRERLPERHPRGRSVSQSLRNPEASPSRRGATSDMERQLTEER